MSTTGRYDINFLPVFRLNGFTRGVFSLIARASLIAGIASTSGCGFKSDLVLEEQGPDSPLFISDRQPVAEDDDGTLQPLPWFGNSSAGMTEEEGVEVESATSVASEGRILISPGDANSNGVPVDLSGLEIDLDQGKNTQ